MCFSPEASFGSAALLLPMGGYCLWVAARRLPRFWGFAVIPVIFAVQQAAEGFVWLGLRHGWPEATTTGATVYLLFALAWWPVWFAVAGAGAVRSKGMRALLIVWAIVALVWFFAVYLPARADLVVAPPEIAHHSIRYPYADDLVFGGTYGWIAMLSYYLCAGLPLLLVGPCLGVQRRMFVVPLLIALVSVLVSVLVFRHAFTSVWCFAAALLSAYCVYFFATAPGE